MGAAAWFILGFLIASIGWGAIYAYTAIKIGPKVHALRQKNSEYEQIFERYRQVLPPLG